MSEPASVTSSPATLLGRIRNVLDFRYGGLVWIGILGTAITFLAGLEGLVALNERLRTIIAVWRGFTHSIWTTLFGWIGIKLPPSFFALLNFAVFALVLAVGVRIRALHFASDLAPDQRTGLQVKAWRILASFVAVVGLSLLSLVAIMLLQRRGITVSPNMIVVIWICWSLAMMIGCFLWTHHFDKRALLLYPLALVYSSAVFIVPFLKSITNSQFDTVLLVTSLAAINLIFSVMMRIAPPVALRKRLSAAIALALLIALPVLASLGVAQVHIMSGESLIGEGHRAEGIAEYRKSLGIYELLARSDPSSGDRQSNLALSYSSFGDAILPDGNQAEIGGYYRKAADIGEKLVAAEPENLLHQRNLSIYYRQLGDLRIANGARDEAITLYRKSVGIAEFIIARNPAATNAQNDLGFYNGKLGDALAAGGDYAGAVAPYKKAIESGKALLSVDRATMHARNLAIYYRQLADALQWGGIEGDDAIANYREAYRIGEELLQENAADVVLLGDQDMYANRLANVLYSRAEYAEAASLYQKSIELREALERAEPQNEARQAQVIEALGNLAATIAVNGNSDVALSHFKAALARSERIVERAAGSQPAHTPSRARAEALNRVAWYAVEAADFNRALTASEGALSAQPDFAFAMMNKAYALLYLGRRDEAAKIYLAQADKPVPEAGNRSWRDVFWEGLVILRRVGREDASLDDWQRTLQAEK